jgi:DNA (cytosine-5)-methyltransferase 1
VREKLKLLDLFSGIGGFSLGLERSGGFETVAFCEIEEYPRRVLAKHWPEVPCYDDVRTLTAERLAADGITVDAICGGFPCQDISVAGRHAGIASNTRSGLWSEFARIIGEVRPSIVFVENVANLLCGPTQKRGAWFSRVLGDLAELGYDAEWENIPASALGAPHRRERVWIMAYPKQVERVRTVFAGNYATKRAWGVPAVWMPHGLRSEMGPALPALSNQWLDQPKPNGMAHGLSDWPHRLGVCGNAVVPQIPELLGRAWMAAQVRL